MDGADNLTILYINSEAAIPAPYQAQGNPVSSTGQARNDK
jgi:hypothetical protein